MYYYMNYPAPGEQYNLFQAIARFEPGSRYREGPSYEYFKSFYREVPVRYMSLEKFREVVGERLRGD